MRLGWPFAYILREPMQMETKGFIQTMKHSRTMERYNISMGVYIRQERKLECSIFFLKTKLRLNKQVSELWIIRF